MEDKVQDGGYAEVCALWRETFGEQPSINADLETMLRILVECLQDVGPFELGREVQPEDSPVNA